MEKYLEFLKTLNIIDNYVACDPDRKIIGFTHRPVFEEDGRNIWVFDEESGDESNDETWQTCNYIGRLPDNIQINNWADTLVQVYIQC